MLRRLRERYFINFISLQIIKRALRKCNNLYDRRVRGVALIIIRDRNYN